MKYQRPAKIICGLFLALLLSQFLVSEVVFSFSPRPRPAFKTKLASLRANLGYTIYKWAHPFPDKEIAVLPRPWTGGETVSVAPNKPPVPTLPLPGRKPRPTEVIPTIPSENPQEPGRPSNPGPTEPPAVRPTEPPSLPPDEAAAQLLNLINDERAKNGAGPLSFNSALNRAARLHAEDMAKRGYFDHNTPEGKTPFQRMKEAGYSGGMMGENIFRGSSNPGAPFSWWMKSPPHHSNMVNKEFKSAGLGNSQGYWVLDLGSS